MLGVLATLYLVQLLVVRRAQAIMRQQAEELVRANRDLDQRVQARTAELQAEVHERRSAEARLDHLAHHDPLTGLPNRLMFTEHLKKSISNAARGERRLAVLFIDLDRFKEVNDTLGHAFGDKLLVEVTHRLVTRLRAGDTLARIGGDEFICILEDIKDAAEAGYTADKLIELLVEPFQILEHELYIDASIGICIYPADGEDVDTLVRNADTAMYQAKEHGRGRSHFYTAEMTTYAQERVRIESLLRRAIDADELEVHYQIKVAGNGGKPAGAEALVRWTQCRARQGTAGTLHPAGRRNRLHRHARRMGAAAYLPADDGMAPGRPRHAEGFGQRLGQAARARQHRRTRCSASSPKPGSSRRRSNWKSPSR